MHTIPKRALTLVLKLGLTGAALYFLLSSVDLLALWNHAKEIPLYVLGIATLTWGAALFINTVRWGVLLQIQDLSIPYTKLLQYNLAFMFYTIALPGGKVSAEAVRVYQVARDAESGMRERAALSALADRMVAALTFIAFVLALAPILLKTLPTLPSWFLYAFGVSAFVVVVSVFFPLEILLFWSARFLPDVLKNPLSNIGSSFAMFRQHPTKLIVAFALSAVSTLLMAFGIQVVAWSLGLSAPFTATLTAFSVGTLTSMIPLTVAGIGIREGTFTYLFAALAGTTLEIGLTISLVAFATSLIVAALGGIIEFRRLFFKRTP